jgi:hypothetical protein
MLFNYRFNHPSKDIVLTHANRELSAEQERLFELGRQDTTTMAFVSVTIYTTVQYRYVSQSCYYLNKAVKGKEL